MAGIGATGLTLAACVASQPGAAPVPTAAGDGGSEPDAAATEIRFATDWIEGVRGDTMETAMGIFAEQNPAIVVTVEPIGGDYFDRLQIQFAGGTVADVILFEGTLGAEYILEGLIADLAPTLDALSIDRARWRPGVPSIFTQEGKVYAIPFQLTPGTWYYNKTLFQEKGAPLPSADWTWETVIDVAKALTDPPNSYGLWIRGHMFQEYGAMGLANGDLHWVNDELTKTQFGEPSFADAIRWTIEAVQLHQVSPLPADVQSMLTTGISNLFATGKIGMAALNAGSVGSFRRDIGDRFEWDIMPSPLAPRTGHTGGMWNDQPHVVTSNAIQRNVVEESARLVVFLSGDEVQEMIAEQRGSTPTVKTIQESETYLAPPPESMALIPGELDGKEGPFFFPHFLEWFQALNKEFELGLIGERGIDETIAAMVATGDEILAAIPRQ